jgi:hypothetical protein
MKRTTKVLILGFALAFAGTAHAGGMANANGANASGTISVRGTARMLPAGVIVDGINDQGWIIGHWTDRDGVSHVFLLNAFVPALSNVAVHDNTSPVTLDNFSG